MQTLFTKPLVVALLFTLCLGAVWAPQAQAEDLTAKLQSIVAELSTEQQAALYLLISQLKGEGAPAATAATSDKDQIMKTINKLKTALETLDLDMLLDTFSEDFEHPQVGGKKEARAMLAMGLQSGYVDDGEVNLDDLEVEIDEAKGTATAYPVDLSSPAGAVAVELELKKEADGSWLIFTLFVDGI